MRLKENVIPKGLKPQTVLAIMIAEQVFAENKFRFVITSLNDGTHGDNSYHYDGYAFDVRVRNEFHTSSVYPNYDMAMVLAEQIRERLGQVGCYDVIFGTDANHMDHMHIEYNARKIE